MKPSYDRNHPECKKAGLSLPGAILIFDGAMLGINPDLGLGFARKVFLMEVKVLEDIPKNLRNGSRFHWLRDRKNNRKGGKSKSQKELAKELYLFNKDNPLWVVTNGSEVIEVMTNQPDYLKAIPEFLKVGRK